jgi:hypothetical protein
MKTFLLILLIFSFLFCAAQNKSEQFPPLPTEKEIQQKLKDERCVFRRKYSDIQLKSQFPFNQAGTIKLVSFETKKEEEMGIIHKFFHFDSGYQYHLHSTRIDTNNWKETVILDTTKYRSLANLMFNYGPFKVSNLGIDWEMQCYQPRNAIVFYDKSNEIIAVIEICFECEKMQFFPKTFELDYDCTDKFELFRKFFLQNRIKYGATPGRQSN